MAAPRPPPLPEAVLDRRHNEVSSEQSFHPASVSKALEGSLVFEEVGEVGERGICRQQRRITRLLCHVFVRGEGSFEGGIRYRGVAKEWGEQGYGGYGVQ